MKAGLLRLANGLFLIGLFATSAMARITINVDAKDGDKISGERTFRVTVQADNVVNKVEFYVGNDLRGEDDSTPYTFRLDTLTLDDGPLKVKFSAYTSEAESASKVIEVVVDNGMSKGVDFHLNLGNEALTSSKWDEAILAGRLILKIDPNSVAGRILLARANLGKGVYDAAQKFAEDVVAKEPSNLDALELLGAINLQRAFATYNRGSDRAETLKQIATAVKSAVDARRRALDASLDKFGSPTSANLTEYADLAVKAQRYSMAIEKLAPEFRKDTRQPAIANRLLYAQMRAGRLADAYRTLDQYVKGNMMDGYGYALKAILLLQLGQTAESGDAEREALLSDGENLGVRTTQAFLALKRNATSTLGRLAGDLSKDEGQRTEVNYYLSALYFMTGDLERSGRALERAVLTEPVNYDMYVEAGNQRIFTSQRQGMSSEDAKYQRELARVFFEAALVARAESFEALTGLAVLDLIEGKTADALKMAKAAVAAGPEYAGAHYALSAAFAKNGQATEANKAALEAGKWDKANLDGRGAPEPLEAWRYFYRFARTPYIVVPKQ